MVDNSEVGPPARGVKAQLTVCSSSDRNRQKAAMSLQFPAVRVRDESALS